MAALGTHLRSSNSNGGISRLSLMQARFQEKLMLEKESRLLEMAARQDAEREDIINRVTKSSSNSLSSSMSSLNSSGAGQGRVRRMFEERRNNTSRGLHQSPKGYDKSFPLDPVKKDGGRPPKGGGRGQSVERIPARFDNSSMGRSPSQGTFQRANRGDSRSKPRKEKEKGLTKHYQSASSLMEGNAIFNGTSRGPSPAPPSSTKSSPGPRTPVTPQRTSKSNSKKPPPPPKKSNFLSVDDNTDGRKSRSGSRSSRSSHSRSKSRSPSPAPSTAKSFLGRFGIGKNKPKGRPPNSNNSRLSPRPPNTANSLAPPRTPSKLPPKDLILRNNLSTAASNRSALATPSRPPGTPVPPHLRRCKICERNFAPDRIQKHEEICKMNKAKAKKRKVFDPVKMRTIGTEAEKFVARGEHLKPTKKPKKRDWRKEHDNFIKTVRAAKGMKGYDEAPPIDTSDYITCPHCGRKFSAAAADRHIPKCADISSNKNYKKPDQRGPVPPSRRRR